MKPCPPIPIRVKLIGGKAGVKHPPLLWGLGERGGAGPKATGWDEKGGRGLYGAIAPPLGPTLESRHGFGMAVVTRQP